MSWRSAVVKGNKTLGLKFADLGASPQWSDFSETEPPQLPLPLSNPNISLGD